MTYSLTSRMCLAAALTAGAVLMTTGFTTVGSSAAAADSQVQSPSSTEQVVSPEALSPPPQGLSPEEMLPMEPIEPVLKFGNDSPRAPAEQDALVTFLQNNIHYQQGFWLPLIRQAMPLLPVLLTGVEIAAMLLFLFAFVMHHLLRQKRNAEEAAQNASDDSLRAIDHLLET